MTPRERAASIQHDTDDESSAAVWIVADSAENAFAWGEEIAERFVEYLFRNEPASPSWRGDRFAAWIEEQPDEQLYSNQPTVEVGTLPDYQRLQV